MTLKYCLIVWLSLCLFSCADREKTDLYNQPASAIKTDLLGFNPLEDNVIASFIQSRERTMSTLYGNDIAARHAGTPGSGQYPADAVLSLVTWQQQPDPVWFGGNIPGEIVSVEVVRFEVNPEGETVPVYHYYAGNTAQPKPDQKQEQARINFIIREKMSATP